MFLDQWRVWALADILEIRSLGRWMCMVLRGYPTPFSAAASVCISREALETQNHQTFSSLLGTLGPGDRRLCMRLVPVSSH